MSTYPPGRWIRTGPGARYMLDLSNGKVRGWRGKLVDRERSLRTRVGKARAAAEAENRERNRQAFEAKRAATFGPDATQPPDYSAL